ncbi:hypothetical protein [Moorena sp. SIO3H5]|nr:hypothetical protein [Moorena sp. SIO3H5]
MRSHLLTIARCDHISVSQLDVIAFTHHSYVRSLLPTTAMCDRIY